MADIKISQLGSAIAVDDSDIVPVVSGGNTLKATAAQLKEHAIGNTSISGIGNGSVTGAISALNSEKQPKTLATSITVDGTPQTTVEGALGAINTDLGSTKQALTKRNESIIIIGSSVGHTPSASDNCIEYFKQITGNKYKHVYSATQGLAGFVNGRFLSLLQGITLESDDLNTNIKYILVLGLGVDLEESSSDVITAVTAFTTYCATNYPNAVVISVPVTQGTEPVRAANTIALYDTLINSISTHHMLMMTDLFHIQALDYDNYIVADGHPSTAGAKLIGEAMASVLNTGTFKKSYTTYNNDASSKTYSWWIGTPTLMSEIINMSNDMVMLGLSLNFTCPSPFTMTTSILSNTVCPVSSKIKGPNNKSFVFIDGDLHCIDTHETIPVRLAVGYDSYNRYMYYIATRTGESYNIVQGNSYVIRATGYIPFKLI